jgi:chitodextrinase
MKRKIALFLIALLPNAMAGQALITLNLSQPTNPPELTLNEQGYWMETYNTAYPSLEFGLFRLTHNRNGFGGPDVGGGMSYWDGFTYCTSGDNNDYGESGSSDGWVANQWGCIAGGGIDPNSSIPFDGKVPVQQGAPYLVAYWGYWMETHGGSDPCLQVDFTDNRLYEAVGVYINNHSWPYYGNIHGDGFARPFHEGDAFILSIHGLNEAGEDIGVTVEHTLAECKDGALRQSADWEWVDLSALGTVGGLYFTMETTDADPIYGPNTAVYFCMDKLQVRSVETAGPARPTGLQGTAHETGIDLSWNVNAESVKGYNLYLNGTHQAFASAPPYTFSGLQPYTSYTLSVEAVATDNTVSEKASLVLRTTDETPPSAPTLLRGTASEYTMSLAWEASTDNVAVTEYHIYLNGVREKRVYTTDCTLTGIEAETEYLVEVEARDAAGNRSERASIRLRMQATALAPPSTDTEMPDGIYNLQGIEMRETSVSSLPPGVYILRYGNKAVKVVCK